MSRTIRRKNAWDKRDYIEDYIDWEWFQERIRHVKYHGLTDEQIHSRKLAWYHGETPPNWIGGKQMKWFARWKLRAVQRQELIEAMKTGEEENLQMTSKREICGLWWYYYD
jgi:hypothetical protein